MATKCARTLLQHLRSKYPLSDSKMFRFEKEFRDNPGDTGESWAIKFLEFG